MKLNKLLFVSTLALPATVAPLTIMTSCNNAWGFKTPIAFGSFEKTNQNNPYYKFVKNGNKATEYLDLDGLSIPDYLQSNYAIDNKNNVNYAYTTAVDKWFETKDKKSHKLDKTQWTDSSSVWASPNTTLSTTCTQIVQHGGKDYSITQSCNKNIALAANINFVNTIGSYMSKYISYAISYSASQVNNNDDFAVSWGGKTPTFTNQERQLYEWIYANSNAYAVKKAQAFLKTTNVNFNFENFPLPSYDKDQVISSATKKLLSGSENSNLGDDASNIYWTTKKEEGKDTDKYTVYTYPAVPVLVRTKDIVQRFVNPQKSDSFFISEFYQNDMSTIKNAVGNSWDTMNKKLPEGQRDKDHVVPKYHEYDISCDKTTKKISIGDNVDQRIKTLNPQGNDFIAFVTYSYVDWGNNENKTLNRHNSVTLSSLSTIMPAYFLETKQDLFVKANKDKNNSGYIVDLKKVEKYSTELINLLSRNSEQGRIANAKNVNNDSKDYLKFLTYLFGKDTSEFIFDFVTAK